MPFREGSKRQPNTNAKGLISVMSLVPTRLIPVICAPDTFNLSRLRDTALARGKSWLVAEHGMLPKSFRVRQGHPDLPFFFAFLLFSCGFGRLHARTRTRFAANIWSLSIRAR